MTIHTDEQSIGETGIGASEAAAALGMDPWKSRIRLWMEMVGKVERSPIGAPGQWGVILEPVVRHYYAQQHGCEVLVPPRSLYHPVLPWLRATPDGFADATPTCDAEVETIDWSRMVSIGPRPRHVQVKCPTWRTGWMWGHAKARTCPPHYRIAAAVELAVTGLPEVDFAVLVGGSEYLEVTVAHSPEFEAVILADLADFWDLVQTGTPPPVDDAYDWRRYFADRLPKQRVEIVAHAELETIMDAWHDAYVAREAAETEVELHRNKVMEIAAANHATVIDTQHGQVTIVQPKGRNPYVKSPLEWGREE